MIFIGLYGNVALRRHIFFDDQIHVFDTFILFLTLLSLELILSNLGEIFDQNENLITQSSESNILKSLETLLELMPEGVMIIENNKGSPIDQEQNNFD